MAAKQDEAPKGAGAGAGAGAGGRGQERGLGHPVRDWDEIQD